MSALLERSETKDSVVRVSELGGTANLIDYEDGMTVGQCLDSAGISLREGQVATMDGSIATLDRPTMAGSAIVTAPRIGNG